LAVVQSLIEHSADVNAVDYLGLNAVFYSVTLENNTAVLASLLTAKADANTTQPQSGRSALSYACQLSRRDAVSCLLKQRADPAAVDTAGKTAALWTPGPQTSDITALLQQRHLLGVRVTLRARCHRVGTCVLLAECCGLGISASLVPGKLRFRSLALRNAACLSRLSRLLQGILLALLGVMAHLLCRKLVALGCFCLTSLRCSGLTSRVDALLSVMLSRLHSLGCPPGRDLLCLRTRRSLVLRNCPPI
jgi:hypothetical protein